jgi:predicted lactoylglutathione lyase
MLLVEPFFKTFVPKEVADPKECTGSIICLSAESREKVDELVKKAVEAGGTLYKEPQDHGFMYGHGYQDLDGHLWEIMWMDPGTVNEN